MADPRSTQPGVNPSHLTVTYGGQVLYPSPLINHSVSIDRDDAGDRETITTTRTLNGQILSSGIGYHYVRGLQRELEDTFATDALEFKIAASADHPCLAEGTPIESGVYPRVVSIDIAEDVHFNRLDYTVVLEETTAPSGVSGVVQNLSNTWQYAENDSECLVDVSHSISAQGLNTAVSGQASNAVDNAVTRVRSLLGLTHAPQGFPFYVQPGSGTDARFYEVTTSREETINVEDGTYSVTESFKLISGLMPFIDERSSSVTIDENNVITVNLQGTVRGYGRTNDGAAAGPQRSSGGTGFTNALSGFNSQVRPNWTADAATVYDRYGGSGVLAVGNPQAISIGETPCAAEVTYSVSYTDDPSENLPSGISDMTVNVTRNDPVVQNAIIGTPFSALGPVFQRLCTTTEGSYAISCNVTARNSGDEVVDTNRAIEVCEQEIIKRQPNPADFVQLKLTGRNTTTDRLNRNFQATFTWTFSQGIASVPSDTGNISLGRIS